MVLLWLIVGVALALRVIQLTTGTRVIENEGAVYLRLADNLLAGRGYLDPSGGSHMLYAPMFPYLIAGVSWLTGNSETAAHLLGLAAGTALIWPVRGVAKAIGGSRVGLIAALLTATHGVLVNLSATAYTEAIYPLFLAGALCLATQSLQRGGYRLPALAGLAFGMAYLTRPEAILLVPVAAGLLLLGGRWPPQDRFHPLRRAVLLTIGFVVVASPYMVWLSSRSGYFRWEGKSVANAVISERMRQGLSYQDATRGLGPHGEIEGPWLQDDQFQIQPVPGYRGSTALGELLENPVARGVGILRRLTKDEFGGLGFAIAALSGCLAGVVRYRRKPGFWLLPVSAVLTLLPLLTLEFTWSRYLFPFVLYMVLFAALAIDALVLASVRYLPIPPSFRTVFQVLVSGGGVALLLLPTRAAAQLPDFTEARQGALRIAGQWLANQGAGTVMSYGVVLPYYARAIHRYYPSASSSAALAYIRKRKPDYLVVSDAESDQTPFLSDWIREGVPDPCAKWLRSFSEEDGRVIRIYSWSCR